MKDTFKYPVIIHKSKYGYDVECPILPGCVSQGDTYDEAVKNIKDAIVTYLSAIDEITRHRLRQKSNQLKRIAVIV